jgi:hypothetical protein
VGCFTPHSQSLVRSFIGEHRRPRELTAQPANHVPCRPSYLQHLANALATQPTSEPHCRGELTLSRRVTIASASSSRAAPFPQSWAPLGCRLCIVSIGREDYAPLETVYIDEVSLIQFLGITLSHNFSCAIKSWNLRIFLPHTGSPQLLLPSIESHTQKQIRNLADSTR